MSYVSGQGQGQKLRDALTAARGTTAKKESYELSGDPSKHEAESASYSKAACGRANLRAAGWGEEDFSKPVITVGIPYSNGLPCNNRTRELGDVICAAIEREGGKSIIAMTPVISDGETNGSTGMKYSLPSRDMIADCMDMMHHGYMADAIITLSGCDKTVPAALMPIPRSNLIGITLYSGAAQPGHWHDVRDGAGLDAADVMEAIGAFGTGQIDIEELHKIECVSLPGSGTCSAMFTANTMSSCVEAMGMALPGSAAHPVVVPTTGQADRLNPEKIQDCEDACVRCPDRSASSSVDCRVALLYLSQGEGADGDAEEWSPFARHHHSEIDRELDRRGLLAGRFHQRVSTHPRDCPRGGGPADHSRDRRDRQASAASRQHATARPLAHV